MKMTMVETKKIEDNPQDYYTYIDPDLLAVILGVKLASGGVLVLIYDKYWIQVLP
jgi:hypothetical protein